MNAQAILQKIEEDAQKAAETALTEAQRKAAEIRKTSETNIETAREEMLKRADEESLLLEDRMCRVALLEQRKLELDGKRRLLDECFQKALEDAGKLPAKRLRDMFMEQCMACACGGETMILGQSNQSWFDESFLAELNAALTEKGVKAPVAFSDTERCVGTGLELRKNGTSIGITLESMMAEQRQALETEVAGILFRE